MLVQPSYLYCQGWLKMNKHEIEELNKEIKIERERKEYYKKQLELLKQKKESGEITDAANFKIQSIPVDIRELTEMENNFK